MWFDEDLDQGPLHINDKLGGGADCCLFNDSDGITLVDSYIWTEATDLNVDDRSIGRLPDGPITGFYLEQGKQILALLVLPIKEL